MELRTLRALESQHRDLLRRRAAIEQELSILAALGKKGGEDKDRQMRAMSLLTALRRELREHFALEEEAGLISAATEAAPRLSRRAARLLDEHADMDAQVGAILGALLAARGSPGSWSELAESFSRFSEILRGHERAEEELLRQAFMDELGGGD